MSDDETRKVGNPPFAGLRVVELGSRVMVPYLGKLLVDAGAAVIKVEHPDGDPFRRWSASGATIAENEDGAWFRFLNAGKSSEVLDLEADGGLDALTQLLADAHLVLDDHDPADARRLGINPDALRSLNRQIVVATLTRFGTSGPWADRAANDFTLQALVGSTDNRGIPGEMPVAVGGDLGDFVGASLIAPGVIATTLASIASGKGAHVDGSQFEAMMLAFQTYRPIFDAFAPEVRPTRQIEIPSVEPASDGAVGFTCITGQQWQDFCAMIGAPDLAEQEDLQGFAGRMERRDELWERIRSFTTSKTVDELVGLAQDFRIPAGPIGTGDQVASFDHFAERNVFVDHPQGHRQPRPPYRFSESTLAPLRAAPALGKTSAADTADTADPSPDRLPATATTPDPDTAPPQLGASVDHPLAGLRVVDLSAFWAGPAAANALSALGADVIKIESHVRLDGMRWASGLSVPLLWEWSPVYHGANAGKRVINLDLTTDAGREVAWRLISQADVVIENYSPRVVEQWGFTFDRIHEANPRTIYVRVPAFGLDGPWRDRVGFAMTMEQVSGLANRTGFPNGPPLMPRGPVDTLAGMHACVAILMALTDREKTGRGQLVEVPLIEGALQAAAEQVVEHSAYGQVLTRTGNRAPGAAPQGLYPTRDPDIWLAVSVETDSQWVACRTLVGEGLAPLDRHSQTDRVDEAIGEWSKQFGAKHAAAQLWRKGVPAAACVYQNDAGDSAQHGAREFFQWYEHPVTGSTPYLSYPYQVNGRRHLLGGPGPTLGQHNEELLAELGYSQEEINRLNETGVTGTWPAMVPRRD